VGVSYKFPSEVEPDSDPETHAVPIAQQNGVLTLQVLYAAVNPVTKVKATLHEVQVAMLTVAAVPADRVAENVDVVLVPVHVAQPVTPYQVAVPIV